MIFYHINYILTSQKGTQAISLSATNLYQYSIIKSPWTYSVSKAYHPYLKFPSLFWHFPIPASSEVPFLHPQVLHGYTHWASQLYPNAIKYCSVLGFMPDFAILEQYVCLQTWGVILGINKKFYTERYQWWILPSMTLSTSNPLIHLPFKWKEDKNNSSNHVSKYASFTIPINFLNSLFMKSAYY